MFSVGKDLLEAVDQKMRMYINGDSYTNDDRIPPENPPENRPTHGKHHHDNLYLPQHH